MNPYPKKILSLQDQIKSLEDAGMKISDMGKLETALTTVGYYRLRGYMFPFYDNANKKYQPNTSFDTILSLYSFDQELSLLLTDILTKIEVALRARIVEALLLSQNALVYLDATYFDDKLKYWQNLSSISNEVSRSSDAFILHNLNNHDGQMPIWAVVEVMSFGTLSKLIKSLGYSSHHSTIPIYQTFASHYQYPSDKHGVLLIPNTDMLSSWIHTAVILRNMCAHNARIYNRPFTVKPQIIKKDLRTPPPKFKGLYEALLALKYLRPTDDDWITFSHQLSALLSKYSSTIDLKRLNFPTDWQSHFSL